MKRLNLRPVARISIVVLAVAAGLVFASSVLAQATPSIEQLQAKLGEAERAKGPNDPSVALSNYKLAGAYLAQGRGGEAETAFRRALAITEQAQGAEHPSTLAILTGLGHAQQAQSHYAEAEILFRRVLTAREKLNGAEHQDTATALSHLAGSYGLQGRYAEAEPLHKRALAIREKANGADHPATAVALGNLAAAYQSLARYAEAEPLYQRALAIREKVNGPEHPDTAAALTNLAGAYGFQGRYAEAEPMYKRALSIREKLNGPDHPATAVTLGKLAGCYGFQGRYAESEPLLKRSLSIREKVNGPEHPETATALTNLAGAYQALGRYAEAEPLYQRALAIREKTFGAEHPGTAASLNVLVNLYRAQARYAEAETLAKRALAIREKIFGAEHPDTAASLNNLAAVYWAQTRYSDLEPLAKRALAIVEKTLGAEHPRTATQLNNLARLYQAQKRYPDAEALYRRALAIREKSLGADHPDTSESLVTLASLLEVQTRYAEAEPLSKRALSIREKTLGPDHPRTAGSLSNLAGVYRAQNRYAEAEPLFKRALAIQQEKLGPTNPGTAANLAKLADLYKAAGRDAEAKPLLHSALAIQASRYSSNTDGKTADTRPKEKLYLPYLELLAKLASFDHQDAADVLIATQLARRSDTADAFANLAQRLAAGTSGELAQLVRDRQELGKQAELAEKRLLESYTDDAEKLSPQANEALRADSERLKRDYKRATRELSDKFPAFAELEGNHLADLAAIRKAMLPNEAMLAWIFGEKESYLLLLRPQGAPKLLPLALNQKALAEEVAALRAALALDDKDDVSPFPASRSAKLFAQLFGPDWDKNLAGVEHLFLIPEGALTRLPFSVLLTSAPAETTFPAHGTQYQQAPWLMRRFGLSVLPSISALTALRGLQAAGKAQLPFLGIGDPLLKDHPSLTKQAANGTTRSFRRSIGTSQNSGMDLGAILRAQPSLPDTADELAHMVKALHANEKDSLLLRDKATESIVKHTALDKYAVLSFATHGVLAGQLGAGSEAGLILTPPARKTEEDDGYLAVSEIAKLRLNADWVILSACNTAGGDAGEAEGLSGLAKAFAYAGAKALFVSHWAVDSAATTQLTGRMFREMLDKQLTRAEAHRQAMLAMLRDKDPGFSHPSLWAPFVIVGDGGKRPEFLR